MKKFPFNKSVLLYSGLKKEEYESVETLIMERNVRLVSRISAGIVAIGLFFVVLDLILGIENVFPYSILIIGGAFLFFLKESIHDVTSRAALVYCYALIVIVFFYGIALSMLPAAYDSPSTSIVVFLTIMPLTVNDRPYRMGILILIFTVLYVILSFLVKTPRAFQTDIMNTLTFSILGFIFYVSLSNRSVKEIYYGKQAAENERIKEEAHIAEESNRAKSNFLANMSHEIRTPMNAIVGLDEMILREAKDDRITRYATDIKSAGKTLLSIINDILDLSKIESGKMELVNVDYDIAMVLNDVVNMTLPKAEDKDLSFELKAQESMPSVYHGDEIRIRQILLNLINNAIKYTEKGGVSVNISYDRPFDMMKITVSDTGMGIRKEDMSRIFSSFQRLDETRNRNIEGTGLGLNITKKLVELMNGTIDVESEYGRGSKFTVRITQETVDDSPQGDYRERVRNAAGHEAEFIPTLFAPDAKILVVDDNDMNLDVFCDLLRDTRIKITTAMSGPECIEKLMKNRYDAILLDQMMPGMSGTETMKKIIEKDLAGSTPMIVLTADAISGARQMYIDEGFDDYVSKPVIYDELESVLLNHLDDRLLLSREEADRIRERENEEKSVILVVSEDPENLKKAREVIGERYRGAFVKSEEQAQKYLESHKVEFILRDVK
ncbi:MAG: response regulator [Lachnospiraceae bacterium]|nr:response regulator [Lachnospiraceae bacterium]